LRELLGREAPERGALGGAGLARPVVARDVLARAVVAREPALRLILLARLEPLVVLRRPPAVSPALTRLAAALPADFAVRPAAEAAALPSLTIRPAPRFA
jgi:hypothetical protein